MGNLTSKEQDSPQVRRIVDHVWERFVSISDDDKCLGLQDLYCAILLVYNELVKASIETSSRDFKEAPIQAKLQRIDINKTIPGPWNEPPTREEVEEMLEEFDRNHNGKLDREEFTAFLQSFTKNVSAKITTNILIFSFLVPLLVSATRHVTERIPKVGQIVRRIPNMFFSSLVTTAIVTLGTHWRGRALH